MVRNIDDLLFRNSSGIVYSVWTWLSWMDRKRASCVSRRWWQWYYQQQDDGGGMETAVQWWTQRFCPQRDQQQEQRQAQRRRLVLREEAAARLSSSSLGPPATIVPHTTTTTTLLFRLDKELHRAVHTLLWTLGSSGGSQWEDHHPPHNTVVGSDEDDTSATTTTTTTSPRDQLVHIIQLLDSGASDTFFPPEDIYRDDGEGTGERPDDDGTRAAHTLSIIQNEELREHHDIFWELLQEMAFSACEKWVIWATYDGFGRFYDIVCSYAVCPPMGTIYYAHLATLRRPVRPPTIEAQWQALQLLCLIHRSAIRQQHSNMGPNFPFQKCVRALYKVDRSTRDYKDHGCLRINIEPAFQHRVRFFLQMFVQFVILPFLLACSSSSSSSSLSPTVDVPPLHTVVTNRYPGLARYLTKEVCLCLVDIPLGTGVSAVRDWSSILGGLHPDRVYRAFGCGTATTRLWRGKLKDDRSFRLAVMQHCGLAMARRKDRTSLVDILCRREPHAAFSLAPRWIELLRKEDDPKRRVRGKKQRILSELEDIMSRQRQYGIVLEEMALVQSQKVPC